jgi:hypothetical protein
MNTKPYCSHDRLLPLRLGAVVLALGSPGCALDDAAPDLDHSDQTIITPQGHPTTVRPEIGMYLNTDGHGHITTFGCTATLIAPDIVVTSNGCLPVGNPSPFPPQAFVIGGLTGTQYVVDRMYRMGSDVVTFESAPTKNGRGIYHAEVGLLHLATPVPSSVATPATIAINLPAEGTASTTFGYGCTERTNATIDFLKRYFGFTVGVSPNVLCPGDWGGPVMYGSFDGHGDLYALNSTLGDHGGYGPGDGFSDVSTRKLEIEDVIHSWHNTSLEQDLDRLGTSFRTLTTASALACSAECTKDARCRTFAWTPNTCFLQSDTPDFFPHAGFVSGLAPAMEPGLDRLGADARSISTATPEECAAACLTDTSEVCQAWSFDRPVGGNPARCWLKTGVPAAVANSNVVSGVASRLLEAGFDRPGGDFQTVATFSPAQCAQQCAQRATCRAFSWASATCHLKNVVPNAVASSPVTSGVKRGLEINIDRPGANIRSFDSTDPSPRVCQASCAATTGCKAWTFVPHPTQTDQTTLNTCYLKSEIAAARVETTRGLISGIRGMEFLPAPSHP